VSRFTNQKKGVHVKHPRHYDAVVIGAGQRGGPLSSALAQSGRRTALIERDHVGGTCINLGCLVAMCHSE
jgi:pyruvate/2-oxoglutarate dehydrogenase complex dihydrolipoamide dehydrogenase (E3) component